MAWFSKSKSTKDSKIFLSEFPTWAAIHSVKLVSELQKEDKTGWVGILKNDIAKSKLVDCFIGAHLFYLSLTAEGGITTLLFGESILEQSLYSLPEKAKAFMVLAHGLYEKEQIEGKNALSSSMGNFYKIKIDPLDACVAFVTDKEVNDSEEFSFLIGGLLPTLNQLRVEQLRWLSEMAEKWKRI